MLVFSPWIVRSRCRSKEEERFLFTASTRLGRSRAKELEGMDANCIGKVQLLLGLVTIFPNRRPHVWATPVAMRVPRGESRCRLARVS